MADVLSLEQLVHLALGNPEVGAVNFNVLKTLLLQMLKAMNLYNYHPLMSDDDHRSLKEALASPTTNPLETEESSLNGDEGGRRQSSKSKQRDRSSDRLGRLEEKVFRFESQLNAFNQIPSNALLIDRAKQMPRQTSLDRDERPVNSRSSGPILEVWQYTQMEKRLESAENGITRVRHFCASDEQIYSSIPFSWLRCSKIFCLKSMI